MFLSFNQIWKRSSSQLKRNFHRIKWQQVRISPQESISFMTRGSDFTIFHQQKLNTYPSAPPVVVLLRLRVKPPSRKAVPSLGSNFIPTLVVNYHYWHLSVGWFKGKSTWNHRFSLKPIKYIDIYVLLILGHLFWGERTNDFQGIQTLLHTWRHAYDIIGYYRYIIRIDICWDTTLYH